MKLIFYSLLFASLIACNTPSSQEMQMLQSRVDSLQKKLDQTYKPGFGEFMSSIQVHHAKLWFAGINDNWPLADFEIKEIKEALENITLYNTDRPESKEIDTVFPAIDSLSAAITNRNAAAFKHHYTRLTQTCNRCHEATGHGFNVVTEPSAPPVSNQRFEPLK